MPLESGKCDTSRIPITPRATPATPDSRREQQIQYSARKTEQLQILNGQKERSTLNIDIGQRQLDRGWLQHLSPPGRRH
jgi:hypothetical protein